MYPGKVERGGGWRHGMGTARSRGNGGADMTQDDFIDVLHPVLRDGGMTFDTGEEFRDPALDVLRYYRRSLKLTWVPVLGRGLSVVAVARQPVDVEGTKAGYGRLLARLAMAVNGRYPPWQGLSLGLTAVILTPEPITPGDDAMLGELLETKLRRMRAIPMGVIRLNLGQEAMAMAVSSGPDGLFPEAVGLADAFCAHFKRFVPSFELS
jgi:hypothetical protein